MKVALIYDRVNKWGGAEQVLLALHKIFPEAPLFTSVYNKESALWAKDFNIRTSFLQNFPRAKVSHELYAILMPIVFESFNFDEFDVVISVTSEAAKGIITKPKTLHICLCLTPTRYLWSGYEEYFENELLRFFTRPAVWYLRMWDKIACNRPDFYIAISKKIQKRIKEYYKRDSVVIYPALFKSIKSMKKKSGDYFLIVSRLVGYKRIDLAIAAANKLSLPFKIAGEGFEFKRLSQMAGETIEFLGQISDDELDTVFSKAKALVFPGIEDFGLVMVEAQAHGVPIIAFRGGGALEIIKEGITGEFFDEQMVESLSDKLANFDESRYNSSNCVKNAEGFSIARFEKEFRKYFEEKVREYF